MPISLSKTFNSAADGLGDLILSALPLVLGVPESATNNTNGRYLISIDCTFPRHQSQFSFRTIQAWLQDKFVLDTQANWAAIGLGFEGPGFERADDIIQGISSLGNKNTSLRSTVATRRKWKGSEPLALTLKLKFEAINDIVTEVLYPCMALQSLCLPSGGWRDTFFLTPPGPGIGAFNTGKAEDTVPGEDVSINIGGFFKLNHVIIRWVKVTYETRIGVSGPVGAEVDVSIESYQMLTKADLQTAYQNLSIRNNLGATTPTSIATGIGAATINNSNSYVSTTGQVVYNNQQLPADIIMGNGSSHQASAGSITIDPASKG